MTTTVILCKMRAVEEGGLVSLAPNVVHCKDARDGSKTWSCSELASEVSKHPKPLVLSQKETWIFFVSHITCKLHKHFESYDNHHRQEGRLRRYFPHEVPSRPPTSPLNTGSSWNHTCKKREIAEIYLRNFFLIFRKILGWEREINNAPKPSPEVAPSKMEVAPS